MKFLFLSLLITSTSVSLFAQKAVAPPDGEYSDPSGLSGTYYPTSTLPYFGTKKVCSLVKIEYKADNNSVTMHAMKGETDPTVFYMQSYMTYARDNYGVSQFQAGDFNIFTVEPGVLVMGAAMWAPDTYPGYVSGLRIADTVKMKPVILVKDQAMASKYTYTDAVRIIGEKSTLSEIHNKIRLGEKNNLPSIGKLTEDRELVTRSIALMKEKWANSPEPTNFVACYIHNNEWGTVQYGKIMSGTKVTFSDEVTAIMIFKNPVNQLCYYYAIGISREEENFTAEGMTTQRGLHMTGNSTIQYITQKKMDEVLAQLPK